MDGTPPTRCPLALHAYCPFERFFLRPRIGGDRLTVNRTFDHFEILVLLTQNDGGMSLDTRHVWAYLVACRQ